MAKKRVVKKKKKSTGISDSQINKKEALISKNLILFAILFVLSFILYSASSNPIYDNLFFILMMFFGFVGVAFLIAFLTYFFLKKLK